MWIIKSDQDKLTSLKQVFVELHMSMLHQSLVFEKANEGNYKDALALMNQ